MRQNWFLRRLLGLYSPQVMFHVTTPTSFFQRLTGGESCADGLQVAKLPAVTVSAATTTLTLDPTTHGGKIVLLASTGGLVITPPAATGTFNEYTLLVITSISGGSITVDAKAGNASDVFAGNSFSGAAGGTAGTFGTASNSNLITFSGSTTGGLIGTWLTMIDIKTNAWAVMISNVCSGSAATPFSNH